MYMIFLLITFFFSLKFFNKYIDFKSNNIKIEKENMEENWSRMI